MPKGSVLVVGGGIAGVQAALDLADSGFLVHLVERTAAIGGKMSQLDKTFPTNDCSACILSPKLVVRGKPASVVQRALDLALKYSTICQSFKGEVLVQPAILVE